VFSRQLPEKSGNRLPNFRFSGNWQLTTGNLSALGFRFPFVHDRKLRVDEAAIATGEVRALGIAALGATDQVDGLQSMV